MELYADEPGMIGKLDDFGQRAVGDIPRTGWLLQSVLVPDVDFVPWRCLSLMWVVP